MGARDTRTEGAEVDLGEFATNVQVLRKLLVIPLFRCTPENLEFIDDVLLRVGIELWVSE